MRRAHLAILMLLPISIIASAQTAVLRDSSGVRRDTTFVRGDTLSRTDTSAAKKDTLTRNSPSGIDSVVTYAAVDSIVYELSSRTMSLYGNGTIDYKELGLKAAQVDINWNTSVLHAHGVPDPADSTGVRYKGLPDLKDGAETYHGSIVTYNFRTKKGKIDLGKTEIEKGLYYGNAIKKVESDVLFVQDGKFTTCDLDHPHYYFGSPTMKVMVRDKVVARPIYLYIADVPVFGLPFGVFPSERGRRSGLIAPAFGESGRGRYLLHLGYYWAMNDYMDWSFRADGYTKGSYTLYSDYRYALRYLFNGSISGSFGRVVTKETTDPDYTESKVFNLHFAHNQEFNPTTRLVVDFTFTSGSYYKQTSNSLNDLLRQNVISNATLTKSWEGTTNSMSVNLHRDQNLQPDSGGVELTETLPSISFSHGMTYPFRSSSSNEGSGKLNWYELIGVSYNGQFLNTRATTNWVSYKQVDEHRGVQHTINANASPKAGYVTLSPFFNYTEKWYDKRIDRAFNQQDSTLTTMDERAITAVRYFDMGVTASTKLYGIFQPGIFGIKGIRHQVVPSISYTYQPDFSAEKYGYYGTYKDVYGTVQKYSKYEKEVFGGAPGEKRQALSMRIGNVFEMKTAADDTSNRENKFQLLNLDLSTSYNFARDSLKFDEVGVSFRTSIGQFLNIGGSTRYNLYKYMPAESGSSTGHRINKFLLSEGRFGDMTSFNISISTRFSGEKKKTDAGPIRTPEDSLRDAQQNGYRGLYDQETPDFSIPWNLDLSWNFSQSRPGDPSIIYRSASISASLGLNLTDNWKFTASANYDVLNKQFAAPQITVYRDLHCWEMNFSWVPIGYARNYRLEIKLKAPQLQDVKVTKQQSGRDLF